VGRRGSIWRFDERGDDRPVVSAVVGACEKRVLAVERQRPDAALDGVGIQFDASVVEEAAEPVPVAQCIANSLGEATFAADLAEPHIEHAPKVIDDDAAAFLPDGKAFIGRLTTDVGLNGKHPLTMPLRAGRTRFLIN
jgi:hypothetical protein